MEIETETIQKSADRFENSVMYYLKKLGFKDVNGGRTFKMGGIQIDVCGGHEDTLLIMECVLAGRKTTKSIRQKLQIFRGNLPILSKAFHQDETYRKYSKLKYILATKNIELGEEDIKFAHEKPYQIFLWTEQLLNYYDKLCSLIGTHARYNLLGEIGVEPRVKRNIQVPSFRACLGNYKVYSFFIEPQKLLQVSYVARREIGKELYIEISTG